MKLALAVALLAAIAAAAVFVNDLARLHRGSSVTSPTRFFTRGLLAFLTAGALLSIAYYHGVTVRAELRSYENATGKSSTIIRRAAATELRRDLFLPVLSSALILSSYLLAYRGRRAQRG